MGPVCEMQCAWTSRSPLYILYFLAFLIGQHILILPATAEAKSLTPTQLQKLRNGDALVQVAPANGGSSGSVTAVIDIPTSPRRVWKTMLDCANASKFVSGLKSCRVVERDAKGAWDIREHVIQWTWLLPEFRSTFRSEYVRYRHIKFRKVAGDLKKLEGRWLLEPLRGGRKTRLHYMATVDLGIALPGMIVRAAIENDIPKTLQAIRNEAVSPSYN